MRGPSNLSWQAVAIVFIGVAGGIFLYVAVPPDDPARGALLTVFNALASGLAVYFLGRRLDSTAHTVERAESKIDTVVEQTNGHDVHPPTTGRHAGRPGTNQR